MEKSTVFELQFLTADNKNKTITIRNPKANITSDQAQTTLNMIANNQAFKDEDGRILYQKAKAGRYVSRQVDLIYSAE
ncbi:DUF2922 domain-containing protein [Aerococcus kribbianus]|uniref:DUF2922 domain-containing protein n=1 Tax=Aerococcus kribbianus TaxID=2999064 RepID=A0A9X3JH83_9LACT|nr:MULTISPECIES: DUF2922 domain-containing protein [unclassified Aerococcus]MCZ0718117.1 DUF2922 domain-containing protein [Aerococcus sp. YH-aer221]MCZ0726314.1 DUF2922 domain-containing protein [Aerococcus sp. YH-aer222]